MHRSEEASSLSPPPSAQPEISFSDDATNQTEWCSKTSFYLKAWRLLCGIHIFFVSPSVRHFCFCVVYWKNTALCQKREWGGGVYNFRFNFVNVCLFCLFVYWMYNKVINSVWMSETRAKKMMLMKERGHLFSNCNSYYMWSLISL